MVKGAATRNIIASLGHAITESPDTHFTYSLIPSSVHLFNSRPQSTNPLQLLILPNLLTCPPIAQSFPISISLAMRMNNKSVLPSKQPISAALNPNGVCAPCAGQWLGEPLLLLAHSAGTFVSWRRAFLFGDEMPTGQGIKTAEWNNL